MTQSVYRRVTGAQQECGAAMPSATDGWTQRDGAVAMITDTKAKRLQPGEKPVGDGAVAGLRLEAAKLKRHGNWILCVVSAVAGKRRDRGLAEHPDVRTAEARKLGTAAREKIAQGLDPIDQRHREQVVPEPNEATMTFEGVARHVYSEKAPDWKNR